MPKTILSKNKTVGIRIPDNNICLSLVQKLKSPIITTSLNISGGETITELDQLNKEMENKIDLLLDVGPLNNEPSTIIDLSQGDVRIIRQGQGQIDF